MAAKLFFLFAMAVMVECLKLEQVFILSRHNVRTPLTKNLQRLSALEWPPWEEPAGHLTKKGTKLEEIMGQYFRHWLETRGLFTGNCPEPNSVYIYSNNVHRTIETAKTFARTAFRNCNISVHYNLDENGRSDPVFAPLLRNSSESYKELYYRFMREKLNNLHLEDAYELLNRIVDLSNSDICKHDSLCDFNMKKDDIHFTIGEEPNVDGPLALSNHIVDTILMSYYNGWPEENIAWGKIKTEEEWNTLLQVTRENQNVRFNQTQMSKDVARPMLNFIRDTLLNGNLARKMTMLVGHDSNQSGVMAALRFKKYSLPGQFELTPVGGKLVFQKWGDDDSNLFLKIEYIYESMKQLRNGTVLSSDNPPFSKVMELEGCKIDENGFCTWSDFIKILETL